MKLYKNILEIFLLTMILGQVPSVYATSITVKDYEVVINQKQIQNELENMIPLNEILTVIHKPFMTLEESMNEQIKLFDKDIHSIKKVKIITNNCYLTYEDLSFLNYLELEHIDLSLSNCENNTIPKYSFSENKTLKTFVLPNSLQYIEENAFAECSNLKGTLFIPENVLYIGDFAFAGCGYNAFSLPKHFTTIPKGFANRWINLKKLNIEKQIDTIEELAFIGTNIEELNIDSEKPLNIKGEIFGE